MRPLWTTIITVLYNFISKIFQKLLVSESRRVKITHFMQKVRSNYNKPINNHFESVQDAVIPKAPSYDVG